MNAKQNSKQNNKKEIGFKKLKFKDFLTPEERAEMTLERKWECNKKFRKREYQIASKLTMKELQNYKKDYKIIGKSLEQFCKENNIDWNCRN